MKAFYLLSKQHNAFKTSLFGINTICCFLSLVGADYDKLFPSSYSSRQNLSHSIMTSWVVYSKMVFTSYLLPTEFTWCINGKSTTLLLLSPSHLLDWSWIVCFLVTLNYSLIGRVQLKLMASIYSYDIISISLFWLDLSSFQQLRFWLRTFNIQSHKYFNVILDNPLWLETESNSHCCQ